MVGTCWVASNIQNSLLDTLEFYFLHCKAQALYLGKSAKIIHLGQCVPKSIKDWPGPFPGDIGLFKKYKKRRGHTQEKKAYSFFCMPGLQI